MVTKRVNALIVANSPLFIGVDRVEYTDQSYGMIIRLIRLSLDRMMTSADYHNHQRSHQLNGSGSDDSTKNVDDDSELLELETALNDIEKAMDKIESHNEKIQNKLHDLLESNRQMAKEFTDIRRTMNNKLKEVSYELEQAPHIAHDLSLSTSSALTKIENEMLD
ncbi:unnamed protein product [Didymodactylos carnosus]|uniref:Uncharacterized protein n=1 Tax=Didymodactylos carnosus TaxID=1234261 RepID=A0A814CCN4_9BILA|nr:unnamed protein product [Didymodactylos carnosus]CAF3715165.1 unnamed protein product [Didymodactylos carnosus]